MELEEQIQGLPTGPGVYLMKDQAGIVLYIGKAKNLRNRVRNYFGKSADSRFSLRFLMPKVRQVETFLTDTEKEALILENTLIKKHKPRHNTPPPSSPSPTPTSTRSSASRKNASCRRTTPSDAGALAFRCPNNGDAPPALDSCSSYDDISMTPTASGAALSASQSTTTRDVG